MADEGVLQSQVPEEITEELDDANDSRDKNYTSIDMVKFLWWYLGDNNKTKDWALEHPDVIECETLVENWEEACGRQEEHN